MSTCYSITFEVGSQRPLRAIDFLLKRFLNDGRMTFELSRLLCKLRGHPFLSRPSTAAFNAPKKSRPFLQHTGGHPQRTFQPSRLLGRKRFERVTVAHVARKSDQISFPALLHAAAA